MTGLWKKHVHIIKWQAYEQKHVHILKWQAYEKKYVFALTTLSASWFRRKMCESIPTKRLIWVSQNAEGILRFHCSIGWLICLPRLSLPFLQYRLFLYRFRGILFFLPQEKRLILIRKGKGTSNIHEVRNRTKIFYYNSQRVTVALMENLRTK